jgi:hypothetical protein
MDSSDMQLTFFKIVGNSTAVAISTADYPNNRTAGDGGRRPEGVLA